MARSVWKEPFIDASLKKNIDEKNIKKIWSRRSTISNNFIRKFVRVHDGKNFKKIYVKALMVNHKFGEFAITRKPVVHKFKKK